jgi:hypothetical protein
LSISLKIKITDMRWLNDQEAATTKEALHSLVGGIQDGCLEDVTSMYWEIPYPEETAAKAEKEEAVNISAPAL